ncbi:hydroxymethylglutaryl-CoA lyase [Algimonas ampicilliniresistens]|uniref:Hydroxymethylglutaryl-CoA lyase n=1 Tax=Algimonas ampicilliniresistens TaxID=1298735 RepID=A0ABQ5V9N2_9PROT|nr:hydroxymethylglutaryl-CoA lyase [Algimonas ampicilliniresistens]GLQ23717.1 hydroxymethylglutaryl-CoA lyase [Algimonas ampicilliniresistens]
MRTIEILDVTARDGLQNEARMFSTAEKLDLIGRALSAGAKRIEVASFAHPKYVPQMADAEAVIAGLPRDTDATFIGLVMNERGVDRALKTDVHELGLVAAASDTFATKNQNQTRDESVEMACDMSEKAQTADRAFNVTIATAFGCPFEGEIAEDTVISMVHRFADAGFEEVAIADTIGVANPWQVSSMFERVARELPHLSMRAHFHNTRNTGLANVHAAIQAGVTTIDASIGGIGGCPFAPNATGNVPSEDVVYMLERAGYATGYDLNAIIETAHWLSKVMEKQLPGMVSRAGGFPKVDIA